MNYIICIRKVIQLKTEGVRTIFEGGYNSLGKFLFLNFFVANL